MSRIQSYSPDIELLKDIPGYRPILKSVLKSQIQFLVEQLSEHTGEESVFLTASITDGTLTHIGSSYGKVFLEDNEEIKSKFLGFCLTHQSKRKSEATTTHAESATSSKRQRRNNNHQMFPVSLHKVTPGVKYVRTSTFTPFRNKAITIDHENVPTESREVDGTPNTSALKEENRTAAENPESSDFIVQKNLGYSYHTDEDKNVFQSNAVEDSEQNIVVKQEPVDSDTSIPSPPFTHGQTGSTWSSENDASTSETPSKPDRQKPSTSTVKRVEDSMSVGLDIKTLASSTEQYGDISQPNLNNCFNSLDSHQKMSVLRFIESFANQLRPEDNLPISYTPSITPYAVETSDAIETPSKQVLLVTDPEFPERFSTVRVNPTKLRAIESRAESSRNPGTFLLNKIADLIFTKEELIMSKGVGSLNACKMEALQDKDKEVDNGDPMQEYIDALLMEEDLEELSQEKKPKSGAASTQSFEGEDSDSAVDKKFERRGKFVTFEEFDKLVESVRNLKQRVRQLEGRSTEQDSRPPSHFDKMIESCNTEMEAVEILSLEIFGEQALIECSVTGKRPNSMTAAKTPLNKKKLLYLRRVLKKKFPNISNSVVTEKIQAVQRKVRNRK